MKAFNEYNQQDPRDLERQPNNPHPEEEGVEQDRPGTNTDPDAEPRIPTVTPETDNGGPAARGKDGLDDEGLIPVKKDREPPSLDGDEEDEEEDEEDEEEDNEEEDDIDREEDESERGRDTATHTGDDFSSPANHPNEANFEDPVQNRKTDPMTDHEPRVKGI